MVDRKARTDLRNALVSYITGEIRAFEFDDRNSEYFRTTDTSVQQISRFLYSIHDDFIDHPISVSAQGWSVLRRILAFLSTDLDIKTSVNDSTWPFHDEEQWYANEHLVDEIGLSEYDPVIHGRQVNRWWNRIPSSVGFALLAIVTVIFAICLS